MDVALGSEIGGYQLPTHTRPKPLLEVPLVLAFTAAMA